jgi:hypothetical protein
MNCRLRIAGAACLFDAMLRISAALAAFAGWAESTAGSWAVFEVFSSVLEIFALLTLMDLLTTRFQFRALNALIWTKIGIYCVFACAFPLDRMLNVGGGLETSVFIAGLYTTLVIYVMMLVKVIRWGDNTCGLLKMYCYLNVAGFALTGLLIFALWGLLLISAAEALLGVLLLRAAGEVGVVDGPVNHDLPEPQPAGSTSGASANKGLIIYLNLVGMFTVLAWLFTVLIDKVWGRLSAAALPAVLMMGPQWIVVEVLGLAEHSSTVLTISLFYFPLLFAPLGVALITKKLMLKIAMAILQLLFLGVHIFMSLLLMYGIAMSG